MIGIRHKRGDTLSWMATYTVNDIATSLTNIAIRCQIRTKKTMSLIAELAITKADQLVSPGVYYIFADAAIVATWPIEILLVDIQYTINGIVSSTETFQINLISDITYDTI